VRSRGFTWKHPYTALVRLNEKLKELGLIEINREIVLVKNAVTDHVQPNALSQDWPFDVTNI
jgi:hypothetical protein